MATHRSECQYQSSQFRQFVEIRQNPGQRSIPTEDITALANAMAVDALAYPVCVQMGSTASDIFTAAYICPIARGSLSSSTRRSQNMIPPKPISYRRQHHDTPSRELPPFKLRSLKSGTIIRPKREIEQGSTSSSVDGPTAADDLSGEPTDPTPEASLITEPARAISRIRLTPSISAPPQSDETQSARCVGLCEQPHRSRK